MKSPLDLRRFRMEKTRQFCRGFTILELLVSMVILAFLLALVLSITGNVARLWKETAGAIGEWQSARAGFATMTRRISQATLNTTWAYFDQPEGRGNLTMTTPVSYGRYSELQFVCGNAASLIPGTSNTTTQAIFFQAPLGQTRNTSLRGLPLLLNACGFFVQFNSAADFRPSNVGVFNTNRVERRNRFRLMELEEPSEDMGVYASKGEADFPWFRDHLAPDPSQSQSTGARPLVENVIALIILPKFSKFDTEIGSVLAPDYYYNSRRIFEPTFTDAQGHSVKIRTLHQLPPLLQITMVTLDENSARRLEGEFKDLMPTGLFNNAPFIKADKYADDLKQLEKNLVDRRLRYRIFSSVIAIRGAKWSGD